MIQTMKLSGTDLAQKTYSQLAPQVQKLTEELGRAPKLVVLLVGEDPASHVYVKHKAKACEKVGIESQIIIKPKDTSREQLLQSMDEVQSDPTVDGFLVQLPLPASLAGFIPTHLIAPDKDVDGLSPLNMGLMFHNQALFEPCTPEAVMKLLHEAGISLESKKVCVVGRSASVGSPMAAMLTRANATVTLAHSRTSNLKEITLDSDIVVVAAGKPGFLGQDDFKPGTIVVDVGIHRVDGKLVGDVRSQGLEGHLSHYTPVPGGVGPMTVARLIVHTFEAAQNKLAMLKG